MSTSRSGLRAQLADGTVVSASFAGLSRIHLPHPDSSSVLSVDFDALPGNDSILSSIPLLSADGFSFLLADRAPSLMGTPAGSILVLRRQHPSDAVHPRGSGFWHIDVSLSHSGVATLSNDALQFTSDAATPTRACACAPQLPAASLIGSTPPVPCQSFSFGPPPPPSPRWSIDFSRTWNPSLLPPTIDTWSPTVSLDIVRLFFVIAATNGWEVLYLDVAGTYLPDERNETEDAAFLRLPQGLDALQRARVSRGHPHDSRLDYHSPDGESMLWYCARNLYGLRSAGQTFWYVARDWLTSDRLGFVQCGTDPCIFFLRFDPTRNYPDTHPFHLWNGATITVIVISLYVDDFLNLFHDDTVKRWYLLEFETLNSEI